MLQGIRAREVLHLQMEQVIQEKLAGRRAEEVWDAFDYMLASAQEQGQSLSPQELKVITLITLLIIITITSLSSPHTSLPSSASSLSPHYHYLTPHYPPQHHHHHLIIITSHLITLLNIITITSLSLPHTSLPCL